MADHLHELERVKLATRNVEQLHEMTIEIEAGLRGDPEGAQDFIRPSSILLQRLLEAQASVEALLNKLFAASRLELAGRR
jgi:hypothetical protein